MNSIFSAKTARAGLTSDVTPIQHNGQSRTDYVASMVRVVTTTPFEMNGALTSGAVFRILSAWVGSNLDSAMFDVREI